MRRNSIADQVVRAISVTGVSIPAFWFALLVLYFFYYKLHLFPGPGRLSNTFTAPAAVTGLYVIDSLLEGDVAKALEQPAILYARHCACGIYNGLNYKNNKTNLLDTFIHWIIFRTAKAKGLGSFALIFKHALCNALIPVLTVIGLGLGNLLGGMVLVETIFEWPGVGQYAYESVLAVDYPAIIGVALFNCIKLYGN